MLKQRRCMNRSCYRKERKERTSHRKYSLTLRRSFPSPSPSCARVAVSNVSSMTRTDVQDQCRIIRRCCCCCSLTTAKLCRSCSWPFRVPSSGLCYSFEARHPSRPTSYPHMGEHIFFPINITASEVLLPNHHLFYCLGAPNVVHLTGQKIVFGIEK